MIKRKIKIKVVEGRNKRKGEASTRKRKDFKLKWKKYEHVKFIDTSS